MGGVFFAIPHVLETEVLSGEVEGPQSPGRIAAVQELGKRAVI